MRIRMIGKNRAVLDEYPKVTIEFADIANEAVAEKVMDILIQRAGNTNNMEESNETCCMSVSRINGRSGRSR